MLLHRKRGWWELHNVPRVSPCVTYLLSITIDITFGELVTLHLTSARCSLGLGARERQASDRDLRVGHVPKGLVL